MNLLSVSASNIVIFIIFIVLITVGIFVKNRLLNEFDKHFIPKHRLFINKIIDVVVYSVIITPIIWGISLIIGDIFSAIINRTVSIISMVVFFISFVLFLFSNSMPILKSSNWFFDLFNKTTYFSKKISFTIIRNLMIISIIISFSAAISFSLVDMFNNQDANLHLQIIVVQLILIFIFSFFGTFYSIFIILPLKEEKKYLVYITEEQKNFYICYSLDNNTLVLGDSTCIPEKL